MFGSVMLDVAIGLILIFLILSFVAAAIRESLEVWLKHRAKLLHQGVLELLHDPSLTKDLYEHPLISSLYRGDYEEAKKKRELPSYIPSRNFALALLDMTARGRDTAAALPAGMGAAPMSMATLRQNITQLGNNKVQRVVLAALDTAAGDLAKAQEAIETWFDTGMDRVSGWYKRKSQWMLVVIGFAVAAIANVDTFAIARHLYNDPGERQAAVAMAGEVVKQPAPSGGGATDAEVRAMVAKLDSITLPIGWPTVKLMSAGDAMSFAWTTLWTHALGWLITGFAVSLGAPFWFDMLNKIMIIRSTVKPHEKSPEESSEDRQTDADKTPAASSPAPVVGSGNTPALTGASNAGGFALSPGADYRPHEWAAGHADAGVI